MSHYKAVLFDLDGTLVDTAPDFVDVVNRLLDEEGQPPLPAERIRGAVSHGARALVSLAFNISETDQQFARLRQRLLDLYAASLANKSRLFEGLDHVLQQLQQRQIIWGIATNKPELYTTPLVEALSFAYAPEVVICPDHVSQSKPHPESLLLACERIGCTPAEMIYIGDHKRDIDCGLQAGTLTIAACYGYLDDDENPDLWNAHHSVACSTQLWSTLEPLLAHK